MALGSGGGGGTVTILPRLNKVSTSVYVQHETMVAV